MTDQEESMEVSGEETSPDVAKLLRATSLGGPDSKNKSSIHNFSFDVSWATWDKPPTPPRNPSRTVQLLSPARFTTSSPKTRAWKTLNIQSESSSKHIPATVKVSQSPFKRPLGDLTNFDLRLSPFKTTDSYEFNRNWNKSGPDLYAPQKLYIDECSLGDKISAIKNESFKQTKLAARENSNNSYANDEYVSATEIHTEEGVEPTLPNKRNGHMKKRKSATNKLKVSEKKPSGLFMWLFVIGGVVGLGTYLFMQINFCSEFTIDVKALNTKLYDNVFGQHIAVTSVISALKTFVDSIKDKKSEKTLVLSFHGWTGVGKNYISKFISEAFHNSRIWWYLVPLHFINEDYENHQVNARQWVLGNVTKCGINVFIIDEMDKASDDLMKGIKDAVETLKLSKSEFEGSDIQPAVSLFIFLSNSKASQINQYLISQVELGRERKDITANEFQLIFSESNFEWYHELYVKDLIDIFVPFLPLEEHHVRQCIIRDFSNKGVNPSEMLVEQVRTELSFLDLGESRLSLTGCKRVQDKVDLHIED